jgi:hypothetical protein
MVMTQRQDNFNSCRKPQRVILESLSGMAEALPVILLPCAQLCFIYPIEVNSNGTPQ